MLEPLVRIAPTRAPGQRVGGATRIVPALCRSVEVLETGVRCRLGDARSSAGNEITSADVEWTLRYVLAANGPGKLVLGLAGVDIDRPLTVEDAKTFTINARSSTSVLAPAMALLAFSPLDSVEAVAHATEADPFAREWLASHSAGFGPYRVDELDPGRQVTLSVNPGYRGSSAFPPPSIPRIVHRAVPEARTRAGLLDSGQAQLVRAAEPDLVRALARSTEVIVERLPYNAQIALFLDTTSPPFDEPAVRRAIACAVDKGAFVRAVSYGQYRVANGITSPEKLPAQAEEGAEPCPRRDLERARRLLARAGGWRGTVPLVYAEPDSGPNAAAGARVLAADLAEAGITVEPTAAPEPERLFVDALRGELPLVLLAWGANVPDAGYALSAWFGGASPLNVSRFASPAADAALAEALRLPLDDPARNDLLRRVQRTVVASAAVVPRATLANQVVVHRTLCGVRPDPVDVVRWQLLSYCRSAQPARAGPDRR
ncbi:MAG: ABC transporter substrate-binding protein [Thermoleophilia bacterium]